MTTVIYPLTCIHNRDAAVTLVNHYESNVKQPLVNYDLASHKTWQDTMNN